MDNLELAINLVKQREGITNSVRDEYIGAIIQGVISELENTHGIVVNIKDYNHLMFVVDYSSYRYSNRIEDGGMPEHLRFRLINLYMDSSNDIR